MLLVLIRDILSRGGCFTESSDILSDFPWAA